MKFDSQSREARSKWIEENITFTNLARMLGVSLIVATSLFWTAVICVVMFALLLVLG